ALALAHRLEACEEEGLVAPVVKFRQQDRTPKRAAELIAFEDFALAGEEVARVEFVVAQEFKQSAVKVVRAGLRRAVQQPARMAEFSGVGALLHFEFLQGVYRGLNKRAALMMISHVHAVHQEGGLTATHAADGRAGAK